MKQQRLKKTKKKPTEDQCREDFSKYYIIRMVAKVIWIFCNVVINFGFHCDPSEHHDISISNKQWCNCSIILDIRTLTHLVIESKETGSASILLKMSLPENQRKWARRRAAPSVVVVNTTVVCASVLMRPATLHFQPATNSCSCCDDIGGLPPNLRLGQISHGTLGFPFIM